MATDFPRAPSRPDAAIADALDELVRRHPSLAPLVGLLEITPQGIELNDAFVAAYHRRADPHASRVLRALLADETLFRRPLADTLTPTLARRFVRFLRTLPAQPLVEGYCSKDALPKALRRWFGVGPAQGWTDFIDALTVPLWEVATTGRAVNVPAHARAWPDETWEALLPLLNARHLTPERARRAVHEGMPTPFARYYFETVEPLAVRNLLVWLAEVFAVGRNGGREQNLLPLQLARRFAIAPRSVPDALALLDVLVLVHDGIAPVPRQDPCGIGRLFHAAVPGSAARFWEPAIRPHRTRWMLGPGYDPDSASGTFDSGLMFNMARALGLAPGTRARLADFAAYYRRVDRAALWQACFVEWAAISPTNLRRCRALLEHADRTPAIRRRDLGNIVSLRTLYGPEAPLPVVARYAPGKPEPVPSGRAGTSVPRRRRGAATQARPFAGLEALIRELDAAAAQA